MARKCLEYAQPFLNVDWDIVQGKNKTNFLNLIQRYVSRIFSYK